MRNYPNNALYGISTAEICRICRVHERTARRWKDGTRRPPATSLMILSADLGVFDPAWSGWVIRRGKLISPEGWEVSTGEVMATPLMRMQILAYQREQRIAKAQLDALEEQPSLHDLQTLLPPAVERLQLLPPRGK
jgi:Phage protein